MALASSPQAGPAIADALAPHPGGAPASPLPAPRLRAARLIRWSLGLSLALFALPARGAPPAPELDDGPRLAVSEGLERAGVDLRAPEPSGAPLWLAVETQSEQRSSGERGFAAMLVLGLPLDRLAARPRARAAIGEAPAPRAPAITPPPAPVRNPLELKPPARAAKAELPAPAPALPPPSGQAAPAPLRIPVVVSPAVARAAVSAALRRAQLFDPAEQVDLLAARAHRAALLPELRLRVSRTMDEGQTLSPTEYDPLRRTATGGTGLWLEARATWRLDRLLFADEELALERLREHRAEQQARLTARVLERLFLWQRSMALADDGAASPEEQLAARLHTLEAEAELDLLTGGWFSAWRASAAAREIDAEGEAARAR